MICITQVEMPQMGALFLKPSLEGDSATSPVDHTTMTWVCVNVTAYPTSQSLPILMRVCL